MDNFYELFDVFPNSSKKEIIMAYENKITKYNNIKTLSNKQIYDIKMLKIGLHVLINHREKYNQINKLSYVVLNDYIYHIYYEILLINYQEKE